MATLSMILLTIKLFGISIVDTSNFIELVIRFAFNLGVTIIVVRYLYYEISKRKDYLFTYMLIGSVVFLLCFLLENVKLQLGFALGLFAIFGIIRYRTNAIPIKEMTYLFVVIGIAVINALANKKVSYSELVFTNVALIVLIYILEKVMLLKHESRKTVTYEKIELIKPEKRKELIDDLRERTGLNIHRAEIGRIDFLKDTARIRVYYYERDTINEADMVEEYLASDDDDD